jgi:hypothetical protein
MSGGHFDYDQYKIGDIADEIEGLIVNNDSTEKDEWGSDKGLHFAPETIEKFKEALATLRRAQIMAQRVDWLVSGDDGEESFHRRWREEMSKIIG